LPKRKERREYGGAIKELRKKRGNMERTSIGTLPYRLLLATALAAISFLALTSLHVPVVEGINDKINHLAAFFTLALLVDYSFPSVRFGLGKAMPLLGYGLAIEMVQYFLPYRFFSLLDLCADAAGLLLYRSSLPLLKHIPILRDRWTGKH